MRVRGAVSDAERHRRVWWRLFTVFLSVLICCGAYYHTVFAEVPAFLRLTPEQTPVPVIEITVPLSLPEP